MPVPRNTRLTSLSLFLRYCRICMLIAPKTIYETVVGRGLMFQVHNSVPYPLRNLFCKPCPPPPALSRHPHKFISTIPSLTCIHPSTPLFQKFLILFPLFYCKERSLSSLATKIRTRILSAFLLNVYNM